MLSIRCSLSDNDIHRRKCVLRDRDNKNKIIGITYERNRDALYAATILSPKDNIGSTNYTRTQSPSEISVFTARELCSRRLGLFNEPVVTTEHESNTYGVRSAIEEESPWFVTCSGMEQSKKSATGKLFDNSENVTINADIYGPLPRPTVQESISFRPYVGSSINFLGALYLILLQGTGGLLQLC